MKNKQGKNLISALFRSIKIPKKLKNVDLDDIINEVKKVHFEKKYSGDKKTPELH